MQPSIVQNLPTPWGRAQPEDAYLKSLSTGCDNRELLSKNKNHVPCLDE